MLGGDIGGKQIVQVFQLVGRQGLGAVAIALARRQFGALRHTFETIGGEAKDQVAVDHIMGHARDDMASVYRERISDERLRAVTDHVRAWLFPKPEKTQEKPTARKKATRP